jgi:hypothetical protein
VITGILQIPIENKNVSWRGSDHICSFVRVTWGGNLAFSCSSFLICSSRRWTEEGTGGEGGGIEGAGCTGERSSFLGETGIRRRSARVRFDEEVDFSNRNEVAMVKLLFLRVVVVSADLD